MSQHPPSSQVSDPILIQCNDYPCSVMGILCCLSCKQANNCPNICPTIQRLQKPEYEGYPHLDEEANTH